jgi:hypothetical protein
MSSISGSDQSSVASSSVDIPVYRGYEDESTLSHYEKVVVKNPSHTLYRTNHNGKTYKFNVYTTSTTPNRLIRSAVTGEAFGDYRVGTYDEDLFFSVSLATGETGRDSNVLFFETPKEYEDLFQTSLPEEAKNAWIQKMLFAKERRAKSKVSKSRSGR